MKPGHKRVAPRAVRNDHIAKKLKTGRGKNYPPLESGTLISGFNQAMREKTPVPTTVIHPHLSTVHETQAFRLLVDSVADYAIFLLDTEGNVSSWNKGAERIKGYAAQEIVGRHFSTFYPQSAIASGHPQRELEVAAAVGRFEEEGWRLRKDGSQFWAHVVLTALHDENGCLCGFAKVTQDFTERMQAEEELRQARDELEKRVAERTTELEQANLKLQESIALAHSASEAKSEFLSRMSHELRTPLNAILGFGQILNLTERDEGDRESIEHILKGGKHLLALVNEILDIEKIEAGRMDYSLEPIDVGLLIREVIDLMRPLTVRKSVTLETNDCEADQYVLADQQRLKQVLINLTSNAIKYNRAGGTARIECSTHDGIMRIAVADTGPGIPDEDLTRVFLPFERLNAGHTEVEGTGLGLALSQGLVKAMNGTLTVQSTVGAGSTFAVELPLAESPGPLVSTAESQGNTTSLTNHPAFTIVAIEDNVSNSRLMEHILATRPNVRLVTAVQGRIGVEFVEKHQPDLILLDVHLPDIMGNEVLEILKSRPSTAHIPVLVVSADATASQRKRLMGLGAADYLTKPLDVRNFLRILDGAMERKLGGTVPNM